MSNHVEPVLITEADSFPASGLKTALNSQECTAGISKAESDAVGTMPHEAVNGEVALPLAAGVERRSPGRFLTLFFCSIFMFGNYYFSDQTTATQDSLITDKMISEEAFGTLSSVYSYPNCFLPFVGGFLLDRMGVRVACIGVAFLVLAGQAMFTLGLFARSFPLLVLGRFVFGLGGESQYVVACTLLCRWFRGKEMAFALAMLTTAGSFGTVATLNTQPALVARLGLGGASVITTCIGSLSLLTAIATSALDRYTYHAKETLPKPSQTDLHSDVVRIDDIRKFSRLFWLLVFSRITIHLSVIAFFSVTSQQYLESPRFKFGEADADRITSLPNLVSVIICPVLGILVDKIGKRPTLILLANVGFLVVQISFMLFPPCSNCYSISGLYVVMGVALSLYSVSVSPCIALAVPPNLIGTAMGVSSALQNVGSSVGPSIVSALHARTQHLTSSFGFIISWCFLGVLAAVGILMLDRRTGRYLWK